MSEVTAQGIAVDIETAIGAFLKKHQPEAKTTGRIFDPILENPSLRVLDIGCGIGSYLSVLRNNGITQAFGFDIMDQCVQVAKHTLHLDNVCVGNAQRIPFRDHAFDVCLCYNTIEHVSDPEAVMKEIRRVLKPEGQLFIDVPNSRSPGDRLFRYGSILLYGKTSHIQTFTWQTFSQLLEHAGFHVHEVKVHRGIYLGYPHLDSIPGIRKIKALVSFLCRNATDAWEVACRQQPVKPTARVCVVSSLYHPSLGGLGRQAVLLTERLSHAGVRLFVITRRMAGAPPVKHHPRIPVIPIHAFRPTTHILEEKSLPNLLTSLSFSLGALYQLWKRRTEYDLVHFHGASLPLLICLVPLTLLKKKVIAKVAAANLGTEAGSFSTRYGILGKFFQALLRRVDCFVATSQEIEQGLLTDRISSQCIARIPNGIDPQRFRPVGKGDKLSIRQSKGLPLHHQLVIFSGRPVARKGLACLLKAWHIVQHTLTEVRLVILGDGPELNTYRQMAKELGLVGTVIFKGLVPDVETYLQASDLFVFPSVQEGFPNALLEAMACGLPVVATRIGGVEDMITHGVNGWMVKPGDVPALADAMMTCLADPEAAFVMGRNAAVKIEREYSLEEISKKYVRLYEQVCNAPRLSRHFLWS